MRINTVEKARKDAGKCGNCGTELPAGSAYKWLKGRYGPRKVRCMTCAFKPSDMTSSDKLQRLYGAQEDLEAVIAGDFDTLDELSSAFDEAASVAREVGDEYREAASNIESGFNTRTSQCDELEEKADACDTWADELESAVNNISEFDEEEDAEEDDTPEDVEERRNLWREDVRSELEDAVGALEL